MEGIIKITMIKLLILLLTLSACTDNIADQEFKAKSANEAIAIINDAKNTSWYIGSSNIADIEPMTIGYNDTVVLDNVEKADTIVFNGGISSNGFWLYEGLMYAPFGRVIKALDLCDSTWNKILHPICFDAEVNDWKR